MFYEGVITVIPTFFTYENKVDYNAIEQHIENQIKNNIKTIVLLGTTSETPTLRMEEKIQIVKTFDEKFRDRLNIIVGLSGNDTEAVLNEAIYLLDYTDAFMLSPPYYNKPTQEGIYQHYKKITQNIGIDFIIYNIPSRCGVNIEPETVTRLFNDFYNIRAIKEASGSVDQVAMIQSLSKITILSGDDGLTLPFMSLGATGVISVASNIIPKEISDMVERFKRGKHQEAMNIYYKVNKLIRLCFIESNPVPVKYIINRLNPNIMPYVRMPLVPLSEKNRKIIDEYIGNNCTFTLTNYDGSKASIDL